MDGWTVLEEKTMGAIGIRLLAGSALRRCPPVWVGGELHRPVMPAHGQRHDSTFGPDSSGSLGQR
jgi:hypothetical protein